MGKAEELKVMIGDCFIENSAAGEDVRLGRNNCAFLHLGRAADSCRHRTAEKSFPSSCRGPIPRIPPLGPPGSDSSNPASGVRFLEKRSCLGAFFKESDPVGSGFRRSLEMRGPRALPRVSRNLTPSVQNALPRSVFQGI